MGERKGVNKWYPPDFDPRKGGINKQYGQHPLRDRAKKISQGILVIRFELPYNIWCGGCGSHVGMGVRYNAEKSKVGNYYTTPIYKFRMKCHLCDNYFEIQTDPKNHDYVILSGARRKEQRWDPHENGQIVPEDKATHKKLTMDAMYKLEHGTEDAKKAKTKMPSLTQIEESRLSMFDDYQLNRMARDKFRAEKKILKEAAEADRAILQKNCLDLELVKESEQDTKLASLIKYSVTKSFDEKQKEVRKSIEQRPLFERSTSLTTTPESSSTTEISKANSIEKLENCLKNSYKDPFSSSTSATSNGWSMNTPLSKLGIKRKTLNVVKNKDAESEINSNKKDGSLLNKQNDQKDQSKIETDEKKSIFSLHSKDDEDSNSSIFSSSDSKYCNSTAVSVPNSSLHNLMSTYSSSESENETTT